MKFNYRATNTISAPEYPSSMAESSSKFTSDSNATLHRAEESKAALVFPKQNRYIKSTTIKNRVLT